MILRWIFRNRNPYIGSYGFRYYEFQAKKPTRDFLRDRRGFFFPLLKLKFLKKTFSFVCYMGMSESVLFNVTKKFRDIVFKNARHVVLERRDAPNIYVGAFPMNWIGIDNIYIVDCKGVKYSCANFFIKNK